MIERILSFLLLLDALVMGFLVPEPITITSRRHRGALISLNPRYAQESPSEDAEEHNKPPTIISRGCLIDADSVHVHNGLIVEGTLKVRHLITASPSSPPSEPIFVIINGVLKGHAQNVDKLHVEGRMEGSVHCKDLTVGCNGVITGDVACDQLNIRPGGQIEGKILCEHVGSESHIFQRPPAPLPEVPPTPKKTIVSPNINHGNTNRDHLVQALHAMSDRQAHQHALTNYDPQTMSCPDIDIAGNPLLGAPTSTTVESYRRNRELSHKTQQFLSDGGSRLLMQRNTSTQTPQFGIGENVIEDFLTETQRQIDSENHKSRRPFSAQRVIQESLPSFWQNRSPQDQREAHRGRRREFKLPSTKKRP